MQKITKNGVSHDSPFQINQYDIKNYIKNVNSV